MTYLLVMKTQVSERANGLLALFFRKRIVFRKSDLRIEFLDNRIERIKAKACGASSFRKGVDHICSFDGLKRR
jgi:hypothetical protein